MTPKSLRRLLSTLLVAFGLAGSATAQAAENVFLVTADGLRWQEVFRGAENISWDKAFANGGNSNAIRRDFLRDTPEASRAALMPFLWGTVAQKGQVWGNRDKGSEIRVTNGRNFSYPGYNEFLTGKPDPRIDSNDKVLNPNTNVFEWLIGRPDFAGRVAAVVNWDALPWILNAPRSRIPVWSGFNVPDGTERLPVPSALTEIVDRGRHLWTEELLDTYVAFAAKHTLRNSRPRAFYVAFGETDDWAHEGHYERYLRAIRLFDRFLEELWGLAQSMPEYRGKTTLLVAVDHGRGPTPVAWKGHGKEIPDSAYIWFAGMGPGIAPLGERTNTPPAVQAQVAATVAAALGEDFAGAHPGVQPPLPVFDSATKP